ncbi:uroplakin-2 [Microcaecilia unicolor]|uniref:Uroplakin-2 n=1 Tax=Microcaecilia unicolor TaxID=1415580 RepID=A0A6P7ZTP0_9AMPH|nr:uroplakin-2 [Microcaecilia unicolor]
MQLLAFLLILLLPSSNNAQDFNVSLASNLVTSIFSKSVVVTLPSCEYIGKKASLTATPSANADRAQTSTFDVPACRLRRDVINVVDSGSSFTVTKNIGYQITNLSPNTSYSITYKVDNASSNNLHATTLNPTSYQSINTSMARSGGMVVITVLLSIAMAVLTVGLIVTLVMNKRQ